MNSDVHVSILEMMALPERIQWRNTCRTLYVEVTEVLRRRLIAVLHPFFDDPPAFLRHLTEFRAVVGGIAALSFILQDASVTCDVLQIYAGRSTFAPLVTRLSSCPANSSNIVATRARAPPSGNCLR